MGVKGTVRDVVIGFLFRQSVENCSAEKQGKIGEPYFYAIEQLYDASGCRTSAKCKSVALSRGSYGICVVFINFLVILVRILLTLSIL